MTLLGTLPAGTSPGGEVRVPARLLPVASHLPFRYARHFDRVPC